MGKLPGKALDWNKANEEQRKKIMEQLVDIYLELEKHPLENTGSIDSADTLGKVGGFSQAPLFKTPEEILGPFVTLESSYTSILRHKVALLGERELAGLPVDNYLAFCWQLSMLPSLISATKWGNGPFYLKHNGDKGDHILVDEDFNITGIIDWEFGSAEAKVYAFSSPCMIWPVSDYYKGKNELSKEERQFDQMFERRGRKDVSAMILGG